MASDAKKGMQIKRTYRFPDGSTDKKIKLLKDIWKMKTEGEVIAKLVADKKV